MTKIIDFSNCESSPRNLEYGGYKTLKIRIEIYYFNIFNFL